MPPARPHALALLALGCQGPVHDLAHGTTLLMHEHTLYLTSPDDDAVILLDPSTLEELDRLPVPGRPAQLARLDDGRLLVTADRADVVYLIDQGMPEAVPVPCGGTHGVVADGAGAWITCPYDARLLHWTDEGLTVVPLPGRPYAVVRGDRDLWVSDRQGGRLWQLDLDRPTATPRVHPLTTADETGIQVDDLTLHPRTGQPIALWQRVDNDGPRDLQPLEAGYGGLVEGRPRIEPRLTAPCGGRYAVFDGGPYVFSGPAALAFDPEDDTLWVAHRYTRDLVRLDCSDRASADDFVPVDLQIVIGHGARGLLLHEGVLYSDEGFDHAVTRVDLRGRVATVLTRRREPGLMQLSEPALHGRKVFHDALDIQLTPSGVVTCATCHPDGGEDGINWFLHTVAVPPKLRRTPPAWGLHTELRPLHWDGEFPTGPALVEATVHGLMGGLGLLVDTEAVGAFMAEQAPPVPRPTAPEERDLVEQGAALFSTAGCVDCHSGPHGTDGQPHDVLAPSNDPDGELVLAYTPSLTAVRSRAPFLHDGRAASLEELLTTHNREDAHGRTSELDQAQIAALVRYLESW
jgi:mono/diheme cytochrome c family protein